jgi:DNA-directed RNA polymerase specialized sigma24 family protein
MLTTARQNDQRDCAIEAFMTGLNHLAANQIMSSSWLNRWSLLVDFSDEQLIRAWKQLPDKERLTLYLIDVEQFSREKVAAIMGMPELIVEYQADRARAELKKNCCHALRHSGCAGNRG